MKARKKPKCPSRACPSAKPAHVGSLRSGAELCGGQTHEPQVPEGERNDADLFAGETGTEWVLQQAVGAAGRDPYGVAGVPL